ncbi:MAG: thioredoxin domain-containing protein [Proteobacteria bacterium]|nr:thioredoxin domain-containing protein [Pseudomonadota bacterium]
MKKDFYLIVGVVALVASLFFGAQLIYKKTTTSVENGAQPQLPLRADLSLLVKDWSPNLGPSMSRIIVVEFLDPECESCSAMHPIVKAVLKDYEGRIRYVLRYMPFHKNSELAAKWLEAAREQGKFWEALNILFEKQAEWAAHHSPRPELIPSILKDIGINVKQAIVALENPEFEKRIRQDKEDGTRAGVTGTPTFFVNGRVLQNLGDAPLRALIEEELNAQ